MTGSAPPRRASVVRRWVANAAWILTGVVLYAICIDVFGGYPRFSTEFWSWVALAMIVVAGVVVWVRHERSGDV